MLRDCLIQHLTNDSLRQRPVCLYPRSLAPSLHPYSLPTPSLPAPSLPTPSLSSVLILRFRI